MKITIAYGGNIKTKMSHQVASTIHGEYISTKSSIYELLMCEIDAEGDPYEHKLKSNWHKLLSHCDVLIDTTYGHKNRKKVHELAKNMGVKVYFDNDIDIIYTRKIMQQLGLTHPKSHTIKRSEDLNRQIHELWRMLHLPVVVRSSNMLVPDLVTHSPHELKEHIEKIHKHSNCEAMLDEYVTGQAYTVILVKNYRGESVWSTPIMEIYKNTNHSNSHVKYSVARNLDDANKSKISITLRELVKHIDHDLISVDFVLDKNGKVSVISIKNKLQYYAGQVAFDIMKDWGVSIRDVIRA